MRLFLDECLSPAIGRALNAEGAHAVTHPRDVGGLGAPDREVLARCVGLDLVLVTANARDFRALVAAEDIHPGLIVLPSVGRARSETLLHAAIAVDTPADVTPARAQRRAGVQPHRLRPPSPLPSHRHGRRRPTIHEFSRRWKQKQNVDGRPSPTMTDENG